MCVSNNFIEQQAYKMTEEIRRNSLYQFVGVDYSDGEGVGFQKQDDNRVEHNGLQPNGIALIKKVFLEDMDGTLYSIEPNLNGLRFAKGEITYHKYRILQRKNDNTMFISFFGIIGFFIFSLLLLSKLL